MAAAGDIHSLRRSGLKHEAVSTLGVWKEEALSLTQRAACW